jgi:hypothetical protein
MIKHFSNWLESVPLLDHSNEGATYAFLDKMFIRFSVPVEVLIDQSTITTLTSGLQLSVECKGT